MPVRRLLAALALVLATIGVLAPPAGAANADVAVSLTDSPDPVTVGSDLHYLVTVTDQGPGDATGVSIDDMLPSGVSFGSATPSQGACAPNGSTVHCDLGTVAANAPATVDLLVAPLSPGTLTDSVAASTTGSDPNATNDTAT